MHSTTLPQNTLLQRVSSLGRTPLSQLRQSRAAIAKRADGCVVRATADQQDVDRRGLLLGAASLVLLPSAVPQFALAGEPEFVTYEDAGEKFTLNVPQGWTYGEGGLSGNTSFSGPSGARRAVGWVKDDSPGTSIVVVISTIGADYTSMGSMGDAYTFGSNLVGSMDRSYLLRAPESVRNKEPLQIAKLIDAKEIGSSPKMYYVEYTVQRPNGEFRHLYSTATLGFNGVYNRFYTVTAQCEESQAGDVGKVLQKAVKSFDVPTVKRGRDP